MDYTDGPTRTKTSQWNTQKDQQGQSQVSGIHRRTNKDKAKLVKYTEGPTRTKPSQWNTQKDQQGQSQVSEIHRRTNTDKAKSVEYTEGPRTWVNSAKCVVGRANKGLVKSENYSLRVLQGDYSDQWTECTTTKYTWSPFSGASTQKLPLSHLQDPTVIKKHISDIRELLFTQSAFTHGTSKTIQ